MAKFNIMGIVFMAIAIGLGAVLGSWLVSLIGLTGIASAFAVGFVTYVLWAFLTGQPIKIITGIIFAGLVWLSGILTGVVASVFGVGGGILALLVQAVIMGFLVGYFIQGKSSIVATTTTRKRR